jgi:hypothetical protein
MVERESHLVAVEVDLQHVVDRFPMTASSSQSLGAGDPSR